MKQQPEIGEVFEGFNRVKTGGRQTICQHCKKPFQTEQPQYISNYWQWNNKTKRYERDESNPDNDEPFCEVCRAEYLESLYR